MSSDDSTDWVTIKIHEHVRDQARDDARTYTEILQDGLNEPTTNGDNPDSEAVVNAIKNELSMANDPGVQIDVQRLYNRLDDLESSIPSKTVDELEARQ